MRRCRDEDRPDLEAAEIEGLARGVNWRRAERRYDADDARRRTTRRLLRLLAERRRVEDAVRVARGEHAKAEAAWRAAK